MAKQRGGRGNDVHVVPRKYGKFYEWEVRHRRTVMHNFTTQTDAERYGRGLAMEVSSDLVVHGKNGKVRRKDSYGHDPRSRRG